MARTPLLEALRRLFRNSLPQADAQGSPPAPVSRRAFVEQSLAGLALLESAASLGCATSPRGSTFGSRAVPPASTLHPASVEAGGSAREQDPPRVAIIGAGLAGLHCAYRLRQAGVLARVYEASERSGGRVLSSPAGAFPDAQIGELGGELIDTNHLTMHALAREFGIALDDRLALQLTEATRDVFWVAGRDVSHALLAEQFTRLAPRIVHAARLAEADPRERRALDQRSLHDWLSGQAADVPELRSVLETAYRGEYGLETREQSALNLIWMLRGSDPAQLLLFGDSDERFHAHRGNQSFTDQLAARVTDQLEHQRELLAVQGDPGRGYTLSFRDLAGAQHLAHAQHVIFALPFSTLRAVDLSRIPLSRLKREIVQGLGYGTQSKVLAGFTARSWRTLHQASGSLISDERMQQVWDTSLGQPGSAGLLTNFLGGHAGMECGDQSAEAWLHNVVLPALKPSWPEISEHYLQGTALRMHWPGHVHTRGGYACYRPGQWAWAGREGLPEAEGSLHFCGEHTSIDHQGFMEGAAESGALVAGALLESLGVQPAAPHAALLRVKRKLEQPAYGELVALAELPRRAERAWQALLELAVGG